MIKDLDSIGKTASDLENIRQESLLGSKLSIDTSLVAEAYDPRFNVISWSFKAKQEQARLDIYADHNLEQAVAFLKLPGQLGIPANTRIGILVHGMLLKEGLTFFDIKKKPHTIEEDTKLSQILEWMGYSLSEEIYLVELESDGKISQQSGYRAQVAQEITASKWRYWVDKGVSQISVSESKIDKEFPNFKKFENLWNHLFKGKFNLHQMAFSYEDIKTFSNLYSFISSLSTIFLEDNLKVFDKGRFDPQKLENLFKTS